MLSGKRIKLFLLRFRDRNEDKQLRSSRNASPDRLQSLISKDFKELNTENDLGNSKLMGSGSGFGGSKNHICESPSKCDGFGG